MKWSWHASAEPGDEPSPPVDHENGTVGRMIYLALMMVIAEPAQRLDPISARMTMLCRSKTSCVAKHRRAMRDFYRMLSSGQVSAPNSHACLSRSTKRWLTDWIKAAHCMKSRSSKPASLKRR